MRRTRTVVVVTLLATALCADRAAATAAPLVRPQVAQARQVARQLVTRLSVSLRQVVPGVRLHQDRQEGVAARDAGTGPVRDAVAVVHTAQSTPFEFRLPPPATV